MNKKILSLLLTLVMVLGSFTTVLAGDFDLIHKTDPSKNTDILEFMDDLDIWEQVTGEFPNYEIEYDGEMYSVEDVQAKLNGGATSLEQAITQIKADGPPIEDVEKWFIQLDTTAINDTIIANGDDNTTVKIEIVDEDGVVQAVNGIVIELSTSHGNFASAGQKSRVTLQNGKGTTKLNSEFSATPIAAELTAKLYEAAPEYQELIGKKEVIFNVYFKPLSATGLEAPPVLIAAESNQADRVTLFFDKEVDIEKFEKALAAEDEDEFMALSPATDFEVWQSGAGWFDVIGYLPVPGNNKALVAVVDVDIDDYLLDNTWTEVLSYTYSDYGETENWVEFLLTDARRPELVEVMVEEDSLNEIRLKFSESIADIGDIIIDGDLVDTGIWLINEFDSAHRVDSLGEEVEFWKDGAVFVPFKDYRNFVDVDIDGWLTKGEHSVTASYVNDWAGLSDPKNVSTTQTLDFIIGENITKPTVTALVESPEQIRMYFDKNVEFVDEEYGENWWLEYDIDTTFANPTKIELGLISTFDEVNQVVLETVQDWTEFFDTEDSEDNYYNFKWRLHADAGVLRNTKNGLTNDVINLDLNYTGSPLNNEDVRSPEDVGVIQTGDYNFDIEMDEPVKGRDIPITDPNNLGLTLEPNTPSQEQDTTPIVTVEFIGKNSAGTVVTIPGVVKGYGDKYSKDMVINVGEGISLQGLVDDDDYEEVWTLNVKNITDDVGNSAKTVVHEFNVPKTVDVEEPEIDDFWIEYAEFTTDGAIRVEFTDLIKTSGGAESAVLLSNYSVNNQDLPAGTIIVVDQTSGATMGGVDGYLAVIIILPDEFVRADSNTLEVAKTLKSQDGDPLKGFLPYPEFTRYQEVIRIMTP